MSAGKSKTTSRDRSRRLKALEAYALERGAEQARIFPAKKVIVDDRVRMKCQIPRCPHYGVGLCCPPNVPTVEQFREALARYSDSGVGIASAIIRPQGGGLHPPGIS